MLCKMCRVGVTNGKLCLCSSSERDTGIRISRSQSIRPWAWCEEARLQGRWCPDQARLTMPCCGGQASASRRAGKRAGLPLVPNTPPSSSVEMQAIILPLLSCRISHKQSSQGSHKQSRHSAQGSKKGGKSFSMHSKLMSRSITNQSAEGV